MRQPVSSHYAQTVECINWKQEFVIFTQAFIRFTFLLKSLSHKSLFSQLKTFHFRLDRMHLSLRYQKLNKDVMENVKIKKMLQLKHLFVIWDDNVMIF